MRRLLVAAALTLVPAIVAAQYPPVVTRSRLDPSRGVNFHAVLLPDTVYVGQQATYQIGVFLNQDVRQRLRRNPELVPPETRSLLVYDLPDAKTPLVGTIDGRPYEVHVYQRAYFALAAGRYAIPPSKLTYALPQTASFFSREESHTLRSEALSLVVVPVPTAARPTDWAGAVGDWRARLRVDSSSGRVGNPLVVTMRIEGRGNVSLLPRPKLSVGWASVVAADERVEFDSTASSLSGAKEFDWLITPRQAGRQTIGAQRYPYFNPSARRFELATSGAVAVVVATGDAVAADSLAAALPLPAGPREEPAVLDVRGAIGASVAYSWIRAPWLLLLLALAPLPAVIGAFRTRRRRPRPQRSSVMRLRDAVQAPPDAASVRRLAHDALRDRLGFDAGLARANGSLTSALRHEGVTAETAAQLDAALGRLDAAVFGGDASRMPSAAELTDLVATVDREARRRAMTTRGARALLWLLLVAAPPLLARQGDAVARSWAEAQTAYAGRDFERAERHFLDVARARPAHPNVWANVGTAAWMAGDTARAVQGWQRALRRAPLDDALRSRLALVRAVQDRGAARVPPIPIQLPPLLLAAVWLAGWAWIARRARRGRPIRARVAWLIAVAAALEVSGTWLDRGQRANHLAVIARSAPLRTLPVLGAEQGPAPLTGEVAHVLQRQGAWAHVQLDGRREGWIATELLLPLGDD